MGTQALLHREPPRLSSRWWLNQSPLTWAASRAKARRPTHLGCLKGQGQKAHPYACPPACCLS